MKPAHRLRKRLLAVLAGLTLAVSIVFSLYVVAFTYEIEDAFLNAQLADEVAHQYAQLGRSGEWTSPRDPRIHLHRERSTLPDAVRELLQIEPERVEFAGPAGSHYHVAALAAPGVAPAWLVYDAGRELVVRPVRTSILWLLAATTLVFVLVALAAGYWAVRRTARRLEALADEVARLDPRSLDRARTDAADDEVGVLERRLDDLTCRLAEFVERERSFTRDASHELRTPLAVIRSAAEQLVEQPELAAVPRRHAVAIRESALGLQQIVDTLLEVAREDDPRAGAVTVPLLPLVERAIVEQAPRLEDKPVDVHVDVDRAARLAVPAPVARILLANLVGNAFSHTARGTVRIETRDGRLHVANATAHARGKAGAPSRSDASPTGGFGFGLAIVRRLCDRFGLEFHFVVDGRGAVATLPLADDARSAEGRSLSST